MKNNFTPKAFSFLFGKLLLLFLFLFLPSQSFSQCIAEFNHYSGSNPDSVHFYPVGSASSFYYWNFGDGTTSTAQYPWHEYTTSGTFYACLTINTNGTYCTWCDSVTVISTACNAEFVYYHTTNNPDSIHFGATSGLNGYSWNFGDGSPNGSGQNVFHWYTSPGTYTICLTVNDNGNYCTWCDTVHIMGSTSCDASFNFYAGSNPDSLHFYPTGTTSGAQYWSFGDGTTSSSLYPWHWYTTPGTYHVCHYVNNGGTYCSECDTITVTGPPACNAEWNYYAVGNSDSLHFYPIGSSTGTNYWSFGDGNTSNAHDPWHHYSSSGTYWVCHYVNLNGVYCSACDSVTVVGSTYCNAEFNFYAGNNPDSIHFYGVGSQSTANYWTFGDGTTSTEQYPWHQYSAAGTYNVCHTENVSGTYCIWCDSVTVAGGVPCDASWSYYTINNPDSVHFYSTGSTGSNYWNFGDGTTSTSPYPWHFYSVPGTYNVCHYVNSNGVYCYSCDSITVAGPSCNTHFSYYSLNNPDSVHFYPTGIAGSFYYWNFGDGTYSTDIYPWHFFAIPGTYNVCLTINVLGTYCTWCDSVTVTGTPPPPCDASFNFYSINNPDSLHFYPTGTTGGTQFWNFGDGTTSTALYPWHLFDQNGTYNVCHTVYVNGVYCTYCMDVVIDGQNIFYNLIGSGFQFNGDGNVSVSTPEVASINIYPNPVSNEFFVVLPVYRSESSIVITDLFGREVLKEKLYSPVQVIHADALSAGVYFVSVTDGTTVTVKKITVIK